MSKLEYSISVKRLGNGPIIFPALSSFLGSNINGPSLIQVPDWVESPLGKYYLYFADHKGDHIKLAYADKLTGPWTIFEPGTLKLRETQFLQESPIIPKEIDTAKEGQARGPGIPSPLEDMTIPHIASPDAFVDEAKQVIRLYYHGLNAFGKQPSRVATSKDGIHFESLEGIIGQPYMRMFQYDGCSYCLAMPGIIYRSCDGLCNFTSGPKLFNADMRHSAVLIDGDNLLVFWTQVGDQPERIYLSQINLKGSWMDWKESDATEVLRPEFPYEGSDLPLAPSRRSATHRANQLRDPAIYQEGNQNYLLYCVAGETGIAIAEISLSKA
jgi:hypothetical protein